MGETFPQQSSSVSPYPTSSSHFQDSKIILDLKIERTKAWLHSAELYDFAALPWETWKCNAQALQQQFKYLQVSNLFLTNEVPLNVDLESHVFNLPVEGGSKFDRAPVRAMVREFGVPDNPKNYYVIKKFKDAERRNQMEWFLETVLMLIKSDYMSDKNYAFLYAIEKGKKIAWAHVFHQKLVSKIQQTDRRKVHKTSRLGPALAAMYACVRNLQILFKINYARMIVPYSRGTKRPAE